MRYAMAVFLSVVASSAAVSDLAYAQSAPLLRTIGKHVQSAAFESNTYKYQCPVGSIPVS